MPLTYFYGYTTPGDNVELYNLLVTILSSHVKQRMDMDLDTKSSGIIINTCGWVEGVGYDVILHCITSFNIDVILVMNHDKLYSSLFSFAQDKSITVIKLPTSGQTVEKLIFFEINCINM